MYRQKTGVSGMILGLTPDFGIRELSESASSSPAFDATELTDLPDQ
jgi:hypothetical protein